MQAFRRMYFLAIAMLILMLSKISNSQTVYDETSCRKRDYSLIFGARIYDVTTVVHAASTQMTLLAGAAVEYTDTDEKEFVANLGFVIITDTTECLLLDGKDSMYPSVQ